jgi:hypothetical protein
MNAPIRNGRRYVGGCSLTVALRGSDRSSLGHFPEVENLVDENEGVHPPDKEPQAVHLVATNGYELAVVEPGAVSEGHIHLASFECLEAIASRVRHGVLLPLSDSTKLCSS